MEVSKRPRRRALERATLCNEGIRLGTEVVPLLAGSVHYFRLEPHDWRPALEAVRASACGWSTLTCRGAFTNARPANTISASTTASSTSSRFLRYRRRARALRHRAARARTSTPSSRSSASRSACFGTPNARRDPPAGKPVVLPVPPLAFPVPSYASEAFHTEVRPVV